MLKITMNHPNRDDELALARRMLGDRSPEAALEKGEVKKVITPEILAALRGTLTHIRVNPELVEYGVEIVRKTRSHQSILVGAGPRATQALLLSSRTLAAIAGRSFVTPDDIKAMTLPVLEHRLILRPEFEIEGMSTAEVIGDILKEVAVPR